MYNYDVEDICPVFETLEFFNRKWILCILMDMFRGKSHFTEFQKSNPQLNNYTLSQTLKYMEEKDLIIKEEFKTFGKNTKYSLTERGRKVNRILYEMTCFSLDELESSKLDDNLKNKIFNEYKTSLNI